MRIVGNDPTLSRQLTATASGAISAAGKPLIVNTDGTVAEVAISAASIGSVADSTIDGTNVFSVSGLPGVSKFVGFARDSSNSNYGTGVVGVVSGSSISYGTKSATSVATIEGYNVEGLTSTTFVLTYTDGSDTNKGKARLGTIDPSDNSITYGSIATFHNAQTSLNGVKNVTRLTDTTFVIAYEDTSDSSKAKALVGTVSGTSLSFGSDATYATANSSKYSSIGALSSTKIAIAYSDTPSSPPEDGEVIVGTISGTSISFGSATQYDADRVIRHSLVALSDSKFVIAYHDDRTGDNDGTAIVGTVSGTNITLGTPVVFRTGNDTQSGTTFPVVTKFNENDFVVAYIDTDGTPAAIKGETSGTTITFGSKTQLSSTTSFYVYSTLVNDEKVVVGCHLSSNFSAIVYNPSSENLTTENFIGTSAHAAADGAKVLVNTQGAIDENQSGLTAGQTFFVDKNGDLQLTTNTAQSVGAESVYESASAYMSEMAFDSTNNKVIIVYPDQGNSSYGTVVVGTVDGTTISFGSPVVFKSSTIINTGFPNVTFDSNSNRVVIIYFDIDNSDAGTAVVGTVSGTSIGSFGTPVVYGGNSSAGYQEMLFDTSANKVVIAYRNGANSYYGTGIVGTVDSSDNSISFGTASVFSSTNANGISMAFDSSNNKVGVFYQDGSDGYGKARVATVSGTSITYGTQATFASASTKYTQSTFDSSNNKIVVAFEDDDNSDYYTAIVGTISGTDITFGSEAVIYNNNVQNSIYHDITFDSSVNKVIHFSRGASGGDDGRIHVGTVSGTDVSFESGIVINASDAITSAAIIFDSNANKSVISYRDEGNSNYGTAAVFTAANDVSGSLATDAVPAGTALSATKLLVKG